MNMTCRHCNDTGIVKPEHDGATGYECACKADVPDCPHCYECGHADELRAQIAALKAELAAERERCAKVCEARARRWEKTDALDAAHAEELDLLFREANECADAIRAGGEKA
jgi:hypothetical protein